MLTMKYLYKRYSLYLSFICGLNETHIGIKQSPKKRIKNEQKFKTCLALIFHNNVIPRIKFQSSTCQKGNSAMLA